MIEPRGIPEADGVGRGEEAEPAMGRDDPVLVQERELPFHLEDPLDHEHDVRAPGIVLVENESHGTLERPRQKPLPEFRYLLAILEDDGVLTNEVDPADVGIEINPDAGPVKPRRHLLDVRRFTRPVIALHHHPPVVRKAGKDGQRGIVVKLVRRIEIRHILRPLGKSGDHEV